MTSIKRSSGDLLADRRADYAELLFANGEHAAAAELMLGALDLAPGWVLGWFRMGEMHEAAGALDAAAEAWSTALKLDPADRAGASLKLQLVGRAPAVSAPPPAFVEALFDQYAPTFDKSLVEKLGYRVPELLCEAIAGTGHPRFGHAVDLGCGTGLMGQRLHPVCDFLEGCDISAAMLKKAEARGVYDHLVKADLQTFDMPEGKADLVTAADVFLYVGALERVFAKVAVGLSKGGLFAFSVEKYDGPEPMRLRETRRYAHSEEYVRGLLNSSGFDLLWLGSATIRQDRNAPVEGLIVVAVKH
ncbi:methyltransferase domain-containing protein [Mesorhizobium sp. BAC0120]|uniref:methyltransferase domain-containing protein n=1 Tax=Mesorhizobium sp. BAC0120 TaxID=3090670 RepID=UPI00298C7E97|nr:methyltransferase domain-containing protein [Mesorhizobium sp. BAC0120]MDW6025293.1 methyltransferase domain-containing protein [Mesorhizobium sp. BAC0120]